jgi:hypothetical protein
MLPVSLLAALLAVAPASATERFDDIVGSVTSQNHDEACARMQAWLDAHPGDPQVAQGLVWMARLRTTDRRHDEARALLARALREPPQGEWPLHAKKALADLDLESHRFEVAIAAFEELARSPIPLWRYVGTNAAENARGERVRFRIMLALVAALALLWLFRLRSMRPLLPPPMELVYALPVLLLIVAAAASQEEPEAHALVTLGLGSVVLLWLNGAWARARLPRGRERWAHAFLGILQAFAMLYCAMIGNGLWEKMKDTIAMGAE